MAVIACTKIWDGRGGKWDAKGIHTYSQGFRVITNDMSDGSVRAIAAVEAYFGVRLAYPYVGDSESDLFSLATDIDAKPENNDPNMWIVMVNYSTRTSAEQQAKDQTQDPTQEPPVYSVSFRKVNRVLDKDMAGTQVANSAGDSFDPPIEYAESVMEIVCERNEGSPPNLVGYYGYQNAVNSDPVVILGTSFGVGQLLMEGITATTADKNGQKYSKVRYTVLARAKKWNPLQILDQGLYFISGGTDKKPCIDANGDPVTCPVALDGAAGQLGHAAVAAGTFHYVEFKPYIDTAFGPLNL